MKITVDISGETQVYGIFGYPVKHSKSPQFQTSAFSYYNIPAIYVPFEVKPEDLKTAVEAVKALNIKGINITVPHKEYIIQYINEISEEVLYIGACNTVKNIDGYLIGYNTDAFGFIEGLKELEPNLAGKNVLVLGAGGASRAVIYGLIKEGVSKIYQANRTIEKIFKIQKDFLKLTKFAKEIIIPIPYEKIECCVLDSVDIIVNTTSVGLREDDKPLFNYEAISSRHIVIDIIYKKTPLIETAQKKGCKWQDGLPMLLYQGAKAFEIWTEKNAPIEVMKKALLL
ncbi:MAG TPA: shikimate dehydrogenase [Hydrogenothermaceae bacterium]|nr:shikimate dehydrogenase [Hydrogenothermaceae bacterium]